MPTSEMHLDYFKLKEENNWSMNAFSIVLTFLTLFSSPFSFAAMLVL